jgi:hypothetical protein
MLGCSDKKDNALKNQKNEIIKLNFYPSFLDNLEMTFEIFSKDCIKLTLKQDQSVFLFDSIEYLGDKTYSWVSFGNDSLGLSLVKPNFIFEFLLTKKEYSEYKKYLDVIDINCVEKNMEDFGLDGITIKYEHNKESILKSGIFWTPSKYSRIGNACVNILTILEQSQSGIIEKTAEKIKLHFDYNDELIFKIISKDPLYIKILKKPSESKIKKFIMRLPKANDIFIDMTNYYFYDEEKKDISLIEKEFKKKYKHLRWIMYSNDFEKFNQLIYKGDSIH